MPGYHMHTFLDKGGSVDRIGMLFLLGRGGRGRGGRVSF